MSSEGYSFFAVEAVLVSGIISLGCVCVSGPRLTYGSDEFRALGFYAVNAFYTCVGTAALQHFYLESFRGSRPKGPKRCLNGLGFRVPSSLQCSSVWVPFLGFCG